MLERGGRALLEEARLLLAALRDRRLALSLCLFALLLLLAAQAPLRYHINIGQADGPGSDLPFVAGVYPPEQDVHGDFRWTTERAIVRLPGVGQRSLQVALKVFPVNEEVARRGPQAIELWAAGRLVGQLPVRPAGAIYRVLLPLPGAAGDQTIELRSTTFVPSGDERSIGAPLDSLSIAGAAGPLAPAWPAVLAWIGAALLAWLAVRRAGFAPAVAQLILAPGMLLAGLAALLDPPRFAFGGGPALTALALGWLLVMALNAAAPAVLLAGAGLAALVGALRLLGAAPGDPVAFAALALLIGGALRPAVARLYARLGASIAPAAWRWLVLIALAVFALRYGGKIYPEAMPGDIGFHANRAADVARGTVLLLSLNRGVPFPYPPAPYLLLAPLWLPGIDRSALLQLAGALLDALSPFLVYAIAARSAPLPASNRPSPRGTRFALLAAAIYSFSAAGFMTTWWNFSTHIFAQFAHLLLIVALLLSWPALNARGRDVPAGRRDLALLLIALFVLQSLVYLGHFGFWMNMSLLGGIGLAVLLLAVWRGHASRATLGWLLLAFVAAESFAALFFYSGYTDLFRAQIVATASGGLTGLAGRAPVDRATLWRTLWDAGFRAHFGFFPLPLALCGLALLWPRPAPSVPAGPPRRPLDMRRAAFLVLAAGTFAIGLLFALLPFLSGSTLSTRWLMFSAWAIAVAAAASADLLWRAGRAGRLLVVAAGGYVLWVTASMWLAALAWRVRPPEPF